ncbi:unnamed protein product, partial [marine sediment metagenome]
MLILMVDLSTDIQLATALPKFSRKLGYLIFAFMTSG